MTVHPGWRRLKDIQAYAAEQAAVLAPQTVERFDGAERTRIDPDAVEIHRIMVGIGALCDVIETSSDPKFTLRVAIILERVATNIP